MKKVILIVFLILIVSIGLTGYLVYKKIQEPSFSLSGKVEEPEFIKKLESQKGNNVELEITQEELQSWLKSGIGKVVSAPQIFIDTEGINFSGKVKKLFLKSKIDGKAIPQIEEEKLKIRVSQVTMSGFQAPSALPNSLEEIINTYLDNQINSQIIVESVELKEKRIIITGRKKD